LSSGEKQLLILFAEGLLQQNHEWIYIADEPELSLHVDWQTQLVDDLRSINPHAQILFATHSPDIVSSYSSQVFDMQKVLA
jgi:predicted ATPase